MTNVFDTERICAYCMNELQPGETQCRVCKNVAGSYVSPSHQLPVYSVLKGRYLVGASIGQGGFGITYIARDLASGQRVAVKELFVQGLLNRKQGKTVLVQDNAHSRQYYQICKNKFLHEAYILHNLEEKQGVVNFLDYFEENNTAYIVMEYLEGEDLASYLKKKGGKLSFSETFCMLRPVIRSLIVMNESGVLHRDISPDNIRCLTNGYMKIMDLGGAKYTCQEQQGASQMVMVKHGYAPPEQYRTGYKIGPWMDVYALAATIYRCIMGCIPQDSMSRIEEDKLTKRGFKEAHINRRTEQALMKALSLKVEDRYMDIRSFYTDLKDANPDLLDTSGISGKHSDKDPDKNRLMYMILGVAGVILLIIVIALLI